MWLNSLGSLIIGKRSGFAGLLTGLTAGGGIDLTGVGALTVAENVIASKRHLARRRHGPGRGRELPPQLRRHDRQHQRLRHHQCRDLGHAVRPEHDPCDRPASHDGHPARPGAGRGLLLPAPLRRPHDGDDAGPEQPPPDPGHRGPRHLHGQQHPGRWSRSRARTASAAITYSGVDNLVLNGLDGNDAYVVNSTSATNLTQINSGDGNNSLVVNASARQNTPLEFVGGTANTTIAVNGSVRATPSSRTTTPISCKAPTSSGRGSSSSTRPRPSSTAAAATACNWPASSRSRRTPATTRSTSSAAWRRRSSMAAAAREATASISAAMGPATCPPLRASRSPGT